MLYGTILSNRSILKIMGKDRKNFLQGLITNDVNKVTPEQGIYGALLSPQGRFQYDFFLVSSALEREDAFLLDCERDQVENLVKRLFLYKLRSDVTIQVEDELSVAAIFGSNPFLAVGLSSQRGAAKSFEGITLFVDPRWIDLGVRVIFNAGNPPVFLERCNTASFDDYDHHRLKLGVPDGKRDVLMDRGLLLECGFDDLHAIDWEKGCYMGQELTARTRYRGLVRKRLIPVRIQGETPAFGSTIQQGGKEVGEMRTAWGEWGIAMLRLEALTSLSPMECADAVVAPHIPQWMNLSPLPPKE